MSSDDPKLYPLPLDDNLYSLDTEESTFYKSLTGIPNDEELKHHIIDVQKKAYQVYPYPCIRRFAFTKLKISRLPAYPQVVQLRQQRENSILLDIGCCFGNDTRKAVLDGWPIEQVVASDLHQAFWDYGHELFKSSPVTFPVVFIAGDAFDPTVINSIAPFYDEPSSPRPDIKTLSSLTPLQGHVSAIHASSFFHLFDEEKQLELARRLGSLLSPAPGSIIFGSQLGVKESPIEVSRGNRRMFRHSPESWTKIWNGIVFKKGSVRVETRLNSRVQLITEGTEGLYVMQWSVTRL